MARAAAQRRRAGRGLAALACLALVGGTLLAVKRERPADVDASGPCVQPVVVPTEPPPADPLPPPPAAPTAAGMDAPEYPPDTSVYRTGVPLRVAVTTAEKVKSTTVRTKFDLQNLVHRLVVGLDDPFLKLKAIHDWIALSIRYDMKAYRSQSIRAQTPYVVLREGRAVCEGYAVLFETMCALAALDVTHVSGYARGVGERPQDLNVSTRPNHAWNVATVGGHRYLIDVTWDAGVGPAQLAKEKYSTSYFLQTPEAMIYSHFPENAEDQLLEPTVAAKDFVELPFLDGLFFDTVASGHKHLQRSMQLTEPLAIKFTIRSGKTVAAELFKVGTMRRIPSADFHRSRERATLYLAPPEGTYLLRLYGGEQAKKEMVSMGEVIITSTNKDQIYAPTIYSDGHSTGAELLTPIMRNIRLGEDVLVGLRLAKAHTVSMEANGRLEEMPLTGADTYATTVRVMSGKSLDIYYQKSARSTLIGLISIPIAK